MPVTAASLFSWIQALYCSLLTASRAVVSVIHAYLDAPKWINSMMEGLLAISAVWFRLSGKETSSTT